MKTEDRGFEIFPGELSFAPELATDIALVDVDQGCLVASARAHAPLYLDAVSTVIVRSFDGETSLQELADDVCELPGVAETYGELAQTYSENMVAVFAATMWSEGLLGGQLATTGERRLHYPKIPPDS